MTLSRNRYSPPSRDHQNEGDGVHARIGNVRLRGVSIREQGVHQRRGNVQIRASETLFGIKQSDVEETEKVEVDE